MKLLIDEMETTINLYRAEPLGKIYTSYPNHIRKFDKLCEKYPDEFKVVCRDEISATYSFPKKRLKFGHAKPKKE